MSAIINRVTDMNIQYNDIQPTRVKKDVNLIWGPSLQYKKGYKPNWIPTLIGQQITVIGICFPQWWWSELNLFRHCWLPVVDQAGSYSHVYIGAEGNKEDAYKRGCMNEIKYLQYAQHLIDWPDLIPTSYTHSDNLSAVPQLHFLASCTSFGGKRKSTRVFKQTQKWKLG